MRVIAGSLKGRRLKPPGWPGLRPTSDKLRETLFAILGERVAGARVLDGYAGTGAIGIEALSRGAAHVTFVESDRRAQGLIRENLEHCGIRERYAMIRSTFARALKARAADGADHALARFDIVLLDPPYETAEDLAAILAATGEVIESHGIVVLEHARRASTPGAAGRLVETREVVAGDSALSFYACRS
jgi:16S rRNA (guanine966-N2)-methyltransferase